MTCDFEVILYCLSIDINPDFSFGIHDIRQNFFITKFGVIEGRGWNTQPQFNSTTSGNFLYVVFIARFEPDEANQLDETLNRFIEDGILLGKIIQNPEIDVVHTIY